MFLFAPLVRLRALAFFIALLTLPCSAAWADPDSPRLTVTAPLGWHVAPQGQERYVVREDVEGPSPYDIEVTLIPPTISLAKCVTKTVEYFHGFYGRAIPHTIAVRRHARRADILIRTVRPKGASVGYEWYTDVRCEKKRDGWIVRTHGGRRADDDTTFMTAYRRVLSDTVYHPAHRAPKNEKRPTRK